MFENNNINLMNLKETSECRQECKINLKSWGLQSIDRTLDFSFYISDEKRVKKSKESGIKQ